MDCPICKSKNILFSQKIKDYEYDLKNIATYKKCNSCKCIYRSSPNILTKKIEKKYYSKKKYLPIKGSYLYNILKTFYSFYEIKNIYKILDKKVLKKNLNILDIACGKGYLIKNFSKNINFKCFGIDLNILPYKKKNLRLINASFKDIKLIKKLKPNIIIMNNFIEHIENIKIIHKIILQMKKNSHLIIITPDSDSIGRKVFKNFWSGYHSPRHKIIYNNQSIKKLIKNISGIKFKIVKIYDPFSNIVSIKNIYKEISLKTFANNISKIIISLFLIFTDFFNKNRILLRVSRYK